MGADTLSSADTLMEQALRGGSIGTRRDAFLSVLRGPHWRSVLAPHVISSQAYTDGKTAAQPDWLTFERAAEIIAEDDEKVQRSLELAGCRFSDALLSALARRMKSGLVESALSHLRTSDGARRALLQRALHEAEPAWVTRPGAAQVIRRQLRAMDQDRGELMLALARSQILDRFVSEIRKQPPIGVEEWSALGRAQIRDDLLYNLAMATLGQSPTVLTYLLRLDPLPDAVILRVMASARAEWAAAALEIAVLDGVDTPALIPLAELGVRFGGRSMAIAGSWVTSSKLAVDLLDDLAQVRCQQSVADGRELLVADGRELSVADGRQLLERLRQRQRVPSAERALEQGRRGETPDLFDAAALVRQLRGRRVREMVREILVKPRRELLEVVLHPLCAVNEDAAREVMAVYRSGDKEAVALAKEVRSWADVTWPLDETTQEIEPH